MAPTVSLWNTTKHSHKMKARKADCHQLTARIGQKVFAASKLYFATCGFYSYNIRYVKQETALHRGEKTEFRAQTSSLNLKIYINRKSSFRRDLLWDWDICIIWLARPHCPTSLKCDRHKEKKTGWRRERMAEKRGRPKDRDRETEDFLFIPPLPSHTASHLHYAYRSFSFRDIKVSWVCY